MMHCLSKPLVVVERPTSELKRDPRNPRTHGPKQVAQIAESIEAFGFLIPIVMDKDDQVIAGHGRLLAARKLDMNTVPTISADHLTPVQVKAF
jgi:ParB-like chromosome segregation protein Spo0J